jgi:hypothetical protein
MQISPFFLAALLGLASCQINFGNSVKGNGQRTTQSRQVGNFTKLGVAGNFDVVVKPGAGFSLSITADDNLLPLIETTVSDGELLVAVHNDKNIRSNSAITIVIGMPQVQAISSRGSGKIVAEGTVSGINLLALAIAGSGTIELAADCPTVEAEVTGSGTLTLRGKCRLVKANIAGSGEIKSDQLKAETANVNIIGSGDATVYASMAIEANVVGSGDVRYFGNPTEVRNNTTGSGSITPK